MFDVKKHGGRPVWWGAERQGHQIILLVHDSRLVDRDAILTWSCDSNNLPAEAEACAGEPQRRTSCLGRVYLGVNPRHPQMSLQADGNNDQEQGD